MKPLTVTDYNRMCREYNRLVSDEINHRLNEICAPVTKKFVSLIIEDYFDRTYQMHGNGD